jgi:NADH:ubiquinone reductase (H+-translocating)
VGLRADKKEEMRRSILETAIALFRTLGFDRTRVQDVVRQLRISEATFFNYFPTKQSVLEAAAEDLLRRSIEQLRSEVADVDRPVQERLEDLARTFAGHFAGDREFASLLASHTRFFLGGRHRLAESHQLLTELLTEGQQRGEIRDDVPAWQLAELFQGASLITIHSWLAAGDEQQPLHERLLMAHSVYWSGTKAEPPPRRHRRARPARPTAVLP